MIYTLPYRQQENGSTPTHPLDQSGLDDQCVFFQPGYSPYGSRAHPSSFDALGRLADGYAFQQAQGYSQSRFSHPSEPFQNTNAMNLNSKGLGSVSPVSEGSSLGVLLVEGLSTYRTDNIEDPSTDQLLNLGLGTWRCNICDQVFRRKQRAYTHFASRHGSTSLICGGMCGKIHCAKIFSSPKRLMAHLNPDNVRCPNCQRIVLKKNILRHQSQHCHS
ncbi:hypothetical protein CPB86DRAFT_376438 [Serendipita vermifera]|nr:hypothetical protein CPB86DRAFT_376438 [Serendipita vermifera]